MPDLSDKVHNAVRAAVEAMPELKGLSEQAYCEAVSDGIGSYLTGVEMRMEELVGEDEDEDEDEGNNNTPATQ